VTAIPTDVPQAVFLVSVCLLSLRDNSSARLRIVRFSLSHSFDTSVDVCPRVHICIATHILSQTAESLSQNLRATCFLAVTVVTVISRKR
jgi:hypothetical protein